MTKPNQQSVCKYCNAIIIWTKRGFKNIPLSEDGTEHRCQVYQSPQAKAEKRRQQLDDEATDFLKHNGTTAKPPRNKPRKSKKKGSRQYT